MDLVCRPTSPSALRSCTTFWWRTGGTHSWVGYRVSLERFQKRFGSGAISTFRGQTRTVPGCVPHATSHGPAAARFTMRVVSALSCFAAAGPLLRTPLPFETTAVSNNDVQQLTMTTRRGTSMVFEYTGPPRPNSSTSVRLQSECRTSGSALMTRGGVAVSKTQGTYDRLKAFLNKRFFLLGAAAMVASARFAPSFGTSGGLLSLAVSKAGEGSDAKELLLCFVASNNP